MATRKCFRYRVDQTVRILSDKYQPKFVKLLHDRSAYDLVKDKNHKFVLVALKEEPLTVKELIVKYKELSGNEKSDKTIYRYLNNLENAELVTAAGQLVIIGKTRNETLYGRTARIFHLYPLKAIARDEKKLSIISEGVYHLLKEQIEQMDLGDVKNLIETYENDIEKSLSVFNKTGDEEITKFFNALDPRQIEKIMDLASLFSVLLSQGNFNTKIDSFNESF